MTDFDKRKKAKSFVEYWENHSKKEKQDDQTFWNMFLRDILDVEKPEKIIQYQRETDSNKTNWIDAYIKGTNIIIEQKSSGVDLLERTKQSDGSMRNAFEQAKNYDDNMNKSNKSDWIITCNFDKFLIYDMNDLKKKYVEINIEDLPSCYENFNFLIDKKAQVIDVETAISKEAGKIIGNIYNEIEKLLINQESLNEQTQKYLNQFCVRLVFCFFAEDSGMFARRQFRDFVDKSDITHLQSDLLDLFDVLNTEKRRVFLREDLNAFPYVNGELFADKIDIPPLNSSIKKIIVEDACDGFDWSKINPTIFGAIFESTLNPETRRSGGMHYTSLENIHKVIEPLFLNDLKMEFSNIRKSSQPNVKIKKLEELQEKIANLIFFDPACGSGNFLTETYMELRRLENNILREIIKLNKGQRSFFSSDLKNIIKVHIQQFYGIEVNDFAVAVSKTALWIAEYQMYLETADLDSSVEKNEFLPLDSYENIIEANALRINWEEIISKNKCNYIMGNPPFVGARKMNPEQKQDLANIFENTKNAGDLDYVACWYRKAADYMKETKIEAALVSTNSITQGEQPAILFKQLFDEQIVINYAFRTFRWDSEANIKAHVHCVIIGFSYIPRIEKFIFDGNLINKAKNINSYLVEGKNVVVSSRSKPIIDGVPEIGIGNKPIDDGNYLFKKDEMDRFIKEEPLSEKYFKIWYGADEFINSRPRYCLWLGDCPPNIIQTMQKCLERVKNVREFRLKSKSEGTVKLADKPTRFHVENMPTSNYLLIPRVSSEKRKYIPIGFMDSNILCSDSVHITSEATLYDFGILTSNVHMAWTRAVCGRLEMRYRYSKEIVYNNFPWPSPTETEKKSIEKTAQMILDARKKYHDSTLADMYGENMYLYPELLRAHQLNDKAVMQAYGFKNNLSESEIVSNLMKMYQELVDNLEN